LRFVIGYGAEGSALDARYRSVFRRTTEGFSSSLRKACCSERSPSATSNKAPVGFWSVGHSVWQRLSSFKDSFFGRFLRSWSLTPKATHGWSWR